MNNAWAMAKTKRLFPGWHIPTADEVEGHSLKVAVETATEFAIRGGDEESRDTTAAEASSSSHVGARRDKKAFCIGCAKIERVLDI